MLLRLVAVLAVLGCLPLPRQARAAPSPYNRKASSTSASRLSDSSKTQQTQKYPHRSAYVEYPDDYFVYYPQETAAYPYYPYPAEAQAYYAPEPAPSYYPKGFFPFDINAVPVPAYPYYYGLQSSYGYYPADTSDRYSVDDEDRWYDSSASTRGFRDSNADVNAAFLRNLIVAQMYTDAATNRGRAAYAAPVAAPAPQPQQSARYGQNFVYGEPVAYARGKEAPSKGDAFGRYVASRNEDDEDDKDVRELRSLIKSKKSDVRTTFGSGETGEDDYEGNELLEDVLGELYYREPQLYEQQPAKGAWDPLLYVNDPLLQGAMPSEKSAAVSSQSTTTPRVPTATRRAPHRGPATPPPTPASAAPTAGRTPGPGAGQKEEPMLRPSTHASAHAHAPAHTQQRPSDSVFDTIRHLLTMDRALSQHQMEPDVVPAENKRQPQKRYVTPEDSLIEELKALKKIST